MSSVSRQLNHEQPISVEQAANDLVQSVDKKFRENIVEQLSNVSAQIKEGLSSTTAQVVSGLASSRLVQQVTISPLMQLPAVKSLIDDKVRQQTVERGRQEYQAHVQGQAPNALAQTLVKEKITPLIDKMEREGRSKQTQAAMNLVSSVVDDAQNIIGELASLSTQDLKKEGIVIKKFLTTLAKEARILAEDSSMLTAADLKWLLLDCIEQACPGGVTKELARKFLVNASKLLDIDTSILAELLTDQAHTTEQLKKDIKTCEEQLTRFASNLGKEGLTLLADKITDLLSKEIMPCLTLEKALSSPRLLKMALKLAQASLGFDYIKNKIKSALPIDEKTKSEKEIAEAVAKKTEVVQAILERAITHLSPELIESGLAVVEHSAQAFLHSSATHRANVIDQAKKSAQKYVDLSESLTTKDKEDTLNLLKHLAQPAQEFVANVRAGRQEGTLARVSNYIKGWFRA